MGRGGGGSPNPTAPLGGFTPAAKGQGTSRGAGLDSTDRSHLTGACSYPEYVKEKFYEYAAMAETIAVLAGLYGKDRQKQAFEALKLGLKDDYENGMLGSVKNFFAASGNYQAAADQQNAAGWVGLFGNHKMADQLQKSADESRNAADEEAQKAFGYWAEQFKEIYNEIKRRYNECGFLYAFATVATDGAINIAIAAISDGLGKAALEALKKIKFFVKRLPLGKIEVEIRHGSHIHHEGFDQNALAKKYGKPEENHAGGVLKDENRPVKDQPEKKKLSNKVIGNAAEAQAKKDLASQGFTETRTLENASGNGLDVVGRNPSTGDVKVLEVKANSAGLNDLQQEGGPAYFDRQTGLASSNSGSWAGQKGVADEITEWRDNAPNTSYEIWKYKVDPETGAVSDRRTADWGHDKGDKPKRYKFRDGAGAPPPKPANGTPPATGPPASARP